MNSNGGGMWTSNGSERADALRTALRLMRENIREKAVALVAAQEELDSLREQEKVLEQLWSHIA